jgi:hypothetical protein
VPVIARLMCASRPCSYLFLNNNDLTGDVPSYVLQPQVSVDLDFNCFNGCMYYRASQCSPPTDPSQLSALVDFYHATGACRLVRGFALDMEEGAHTGPVGSIALHACRSDALLCRRPIVESAVQRVRALAGGRSVC